MTLNALDQPRSGYTYVTEVKPANHASLIALRDLLRSAQQDEAARAVENAIKACHEATLNLHAIELASALDIPDSDELERDVAQYAGQHMASNLYDFTDMPKDMPVIDFDQIDEIPY